jgi:hypothetical protein
VKLLRQQLQKEKETAEKIILGITEELAAAGVCLLVIG